jgi:hypothetical protein
MMTVSELVDILSDFDPDTEVRLAMQPKWSFEYTIGEVVCSPDDDDPDAYGDRGYIVYIGEGDQVGYLNSDAKERLGW